MNQIKLIVTANTPLTLQSFLLGQKNVSRRLLTKLKRTDGGITRGGCTVRSIDTVYPGDVILLKIDDTSLLEPNPSLNVPIAYENENIVIFDKPGNMPVHPSVKHQGDTLGNYFAALYPELTFRPVNRLDRDTSGLCIAAKNAHSANILQGNCSKIYYTAVHGSMDDFGTIDAPIARETESIILRCVREDGQQAVTHYKTLRRSEKYSLEEIRLETGRTHQIRVHFAHIGHPVAGDDLYGGSREDISRQALHCGSISFREPLTNEYITVNSALPKDIMSLFGNV